MQLPRLVAPWESTWSTLACVLHLGNAIFVCICFRWRACTWQRGADAWRPSRPWLNAKAQLQRDERKIRPHVKPHPHIRTHTHTIPATIMTLNRSRAHPHTLTHSDTYVQNHNCVHSHSHTFTTHSLTFIHTHTRSLHNPGCMGPCERPCDGFCVRLCDNFFCAGFCGGLCVWILRKIMHGSVFG